MTLPEPDPLDTDPAVAGTAPSSPLNAEFAAAYEELRRVARRVLRFERETLSLNPPGLVNDTYLLLASQDRMRWRDRRHFLNVAAVVMRRLVIDRARERLSLKRGAGAAHLSLEEAAQLAHDDAGDLLRLDAVLDSLAQVSERAARVAECRFFAGLTVNETAEALGIAPATVNRDWATARAWLKRSLADSTDAD